MDEKDVSGSFMVISDEKNIDSLYPMYFGVSCVFYALKLLPEPEICDNKWLEIRNRMLQGGAHLLGLLVWTIQKVGGSCGKSNLLRKLENAEKEIVELKKIRREDAKANQKVVCIVAAREQGWFDERKKLRQQIGGLMNDLRVLDTKKDKSISDLNTRLMETESVIHSKDKSIEEMENKRWEIEENLKKVENMVDELRETGKREAQRHSSEITKHKTAFIELVSNQRQLEAEMGRALRQVEAAKQEIDSALEQKEQSVLLNQRLSMEIVRMRNELEQKDQILSAMLRKSRLDTAEKHMLLKEVKSSKAKRKQDELERTRWKMVSESKHENRSLRSMLSKHVHGNRLIKSLDTGDFRSAKNDYPLEFEPYLTDETEESCNVGHLENWEVETYKIAMEQRRNLEIDAFVEQLRLKDEKLEACRWHLMSMELESKRLKSHMEGLDHEIAQLRQNNLKLESLLLDREAELHTMKEQLGLQFNSPNLQKLNFYPSLHEQDTVWSKVKVIKRKPGQKKQEMKEITNTPANEQLKDIVLTLKSPGKEIKDGEVNNHLRKGSIESDEASNAETSTSFVSKMSKSTLKMDIHALGVSYKIKRLNQQLLMFERLMGKQESCEKSENKNLVGQNGFYTLISLLNKHVDRYQSLQGKTDDLCERMHEGNLNLRDSAIPRTGVETKRLEQFLEETFQLQRYIVATGQKLMEVQAKIASGFVCDMEEMETTESFDMKRFADNIRTMFREVQRGLEVRISRIIGDLGGTLACDGIIHFQK